MHFVRLTGGGLLKPIIIGNIYVPVRLHKKKEVARTCSSAINQIKQKYPTDPVLLGGDFNQTLAEVQTTYDVVHSPLVFVDNLGSKPTRQRRSSASGRQIDHFAFTNLASSDSLGPVRVLEHYCDISDHYPIAVKIKDWKSSVVIARHGGNQYSEGRQRQAILD